MKHPSDGILALYAGADLGWFSRRRVERHVTRCEQCRLEVQGYTELRYRVAELDEMPGLAWNRLAAEMKANIRLGLVAGECVAREPQPRLFAGPRGLVASASVLVLLAAGFFVAERPSPTPRSASIAVETGTVLETTPQGIQLRENGQVLSLLHGKAKDVTYSAGAQGVMRARYVDADTGYVTINNVYAQ